MVDALCELHKQMAAKLKGASGLAHDALVADVHLLMDTLNTLEALCRHENAALFFEQVCTPSRGETARQLTEAYQKGEFAKKAMLRYLFKGSDLGSEEELERMMEGDEGAALGGAWPAGADVERLWTMAIFGLVLASLAGGAYMLLG